MRNTDRIPKVVPRWLLSKEFYDELSKTYDKVSMRRRRYIAKVNEIVGFSLNQAKPNILVDVGCGDGRRIEEILKMCDSVENLICIEPSERMRRLAVDNLKNIDIFHTFLGVNLEEIDRKLGADACVALWNVLGHCDDLDRSIAYVNWHLREGGRFIFDVNNQMNIKQYGISAVLGYIVRSFLKQERSDKYKIRCNDSSCYVRIYSPRKVLRSLNKAGFKVERIHFIDYESGKPATALTGQLVVEAVK